MSNHPKGVITHANLPSTAVAKLDDLATRYDSITVRKDNGEWEVTINNGRARYTYCAPELGRALSSLYLTHNLGS